MKRFISFSSVVILLSIAIPATLILPEGNLHAGQLKKSYSAIDLLVESVAGFKEMAVVDFQKAIGQYGTSKAEKQASAIGKELALELEPPLTWAYLIGFSYYIIGGQQGDQPVAGFYNPWADVFVLTAWDMIGGHLKIKDLEVAPGDCVRSGWQSFSFKPYWQRIRERAPHALGTAVAQSLQAFEQRFPDRWKGSWRTRLSLPGKEAPATCLYHPASLRIGMAIRGPELMRSADSSEPFYYACRMALVDALKQFTRDKAGKIVPGANATPPAVARMLKQMPAEWYGGLSLTAVLRGEDVCQVFLARMNGAPMALAVFMVRDGGRARISRFDLVDYPAYLNLLAEKDR